MGEGEPTGLDAVEWAKKSSKQWSRRVINYFYG